MYLHEVLGVTSSFCLEWVSEPESNPTPGLHPSDQRSGIHIQVQAHLRDVVGLVLDHCDRASHNIFAGGGSYLQFVQSATSVRHNKVRWGTVKWGMPVYLMGQWGRWASVGEIEGVNAHVESSQVQFKISSYHRVVLICPPLHLILICWMSGLFHSEQSCYGFILARGVQTFGVSGPHWKKSCLGSYI